MTISLKNDAAVTPAPNVTASHHLDGTLTIGATPLGVKLTPAEAEQFDQDTAAYRQKFNFPFVICARENKKEAILAAFPIRLQNTPDQEVTTALAEIAKIARLRLMDSISE